MGRGSVILNYANDRNNGLSVISQFDNLKGLGWGPGASSIKYICGPINVTRPGLWKIIVYRDDPDIDQWLFYQLIDINEHSLGLQPAITDDILTVFNEYTRNCMVYIPDEFERWQLVQTISVPYTTLSANTCDISMAVDDISSRTFMTISDTSYDSGGGITGAVFVYVFDPVTNTFGLKQTLTSPAGAGTFGYGAAVAVRSSSVFVGSPLYTTASSEDGVVYQYELVAPDGVVWSVVHTFIGESFFQGHFGQSIYAAGTFADLRLVIGAPGVNNAAGRIYFQHRSVGVWSLNTQLDAPPGYQAAGNMFGDNVAMIETQAVIAATGETAGQGAAYIYEYVGGVWVIGKDVTLLNIARFTSAGADAYGRYSLIADRVAAVTYTINDQPRIVLLNKTLPGGWISYDLLDADKLFLKRTVDESFYHLASGNISIKFKIEIPIYGSYCVTLDMDSAIELIGPHNDKVYFVEDGAYKTAPLAHGNYTATQLAAHVQAQMNEYSTWPNNYTIAYDAGTNKFSATALNPFAFGSNLSTSFADSCQNKVLGFYDNHNTVLALSYVADAEAAVGVLDEIGVQILGGYPNKPVRNNCYFAETGMRARLVSGRYKIVAADNAIVKIPFTTSELVAVFPHLEGGTYLKVNTNDIQLRLDAL